MRLIKIQEFLRAHHFPYKYWEDEECGSIEFEYRGLTYHVWEYPPSDPGAQSNVRCVGRQEDFGKNYEDEILAILESWEGIS